MRTDFDFIVVGGGSAGCVLAARLSEQKGVSVLLVEAGPDANPWTIRMPLAVDRLLTGTTYNWAFSSVDEAGLGGQGGAAPTGACPWRVVGHQRHGLYARQPDGLRGMARFLRV